MNTNSVRSEIRRHGDGRRFLRFRGRLDPGARAVRSRGSAAEREGDPADAAGA